MEILFLSECSAYCLFMGLVVDTRGLAIKFLISELSIL